MSTKTPKNELRCEDCQRPIEDRPNPYPAPPPNDGEVPVVAGDRNDGKPAFWCFDCATRRMSPAERAEFERELQTTQKAMSDPAYIGGSLLKKTVERVIERRCTNPMETGVGLNFDERTMTIWFDCPYDLGGTLSELLTAAFAAELVDNAVKWSDWLIRPLMTLAIPFDDLEKLVPYLKD